jgi:hypothetical protein
MRVELSRRFVVTAIALTGMAAALALMLTPSAFAAFPGQNGRIAFANGSGIASVNPDGTDERQLTYAPPQIGDWAPDWSADGQKIVYQGTDGEDYHTMVVNADGTGWTTVPGTTGSEYPTWSPDARKLAFSACGIYVFQYPPAGGYVPPLTSWCHDRQPDWSPDGTRIAFSSDRDGGYEIYTVNAADGSDVQRLTTNPGDDTYPDWSPDGSRLVFGNALAGKLYTVHADGTGLTQLPPGGAEPAWSPDGRKIAFHGGGLTIMNADGTGVVNTGVSIYGTPDWQPIVHDAPQSASTLSFSLVPMFRQTISTTQCASRGGQNGTHGSPLALPSCNPPGYLSNTMAKLGPASSAHVQATTIPGDRLTSADEADLSLVVNATDVRNRQGGGDYDPSPGTDVTLNLLIRLSDTYNGASLATPATTSDFIYPVPVACTASADPVAGSTCSTNATADALTPNTIREGKRTVMTTFRYWLYDSGLNATRGDADDRGFAQPGVYVP